MSESTGPKVERGVQIPDVADTNPWQLLGWLESTLIHKGRITKTDWNKAATACRKPQTATGEPTT